MKKINYEQLRKIVGGDHEDVLAVARDMDRLKQGMVGQISLDSEELFELQLRINRLGIHSGQIPDHGS